MGEPNLRWLLNCFPGLWLPASLIDSVHLEGTWWVIAQFTSSLTEDHQFSLGTLLVTRSSLAQKVVPSFGKTRYKKTQGEEVKSTLLHAPPNMTPTSLVVKLEVGMCWGLFCLGGVLLELYLPQFLQQGDVWPAECFHHVPLVWQVLRLLEPQLSLWDSPGQPPVWQPCHCLLLYLHGSVG